MLSPDDTRNSRLTSHGIFNPLPLPTYNGGSMGAGRKLALFFSVSLLCSCRVSDLGMVKGGEEGGDVRKG